MNGFVALHLIACLDPTNHNTCVSLPVTDSTQAQLDGSEMSMMGCMGIEGDNSRRSSGRIIRICTRRITSVDGPAKSEIRRLPIGGTLEADHDLRLRARPTRGTTRQTHSSLSVRYRHPRMARMAQRFLRRAVYGIPSGCEVIHARHC